VRTVGVRLTADIGQYVSKLKMAKDATADFAGQLNKASKNGKLDTVTKAAAGLGVGLVGLAAGAVKMRMDFDKSMSAVAAATHAPKGELDQLRTAAIQAGKDTQFSATQAADGITELSKAGVSTASILGGGLKGALDLAAAGQIDVSEAAETAASAMTQFKLSGSAVPHVADLLAAAAGKAQGSVHDMGYALNQSGLVASQFGLSIEDTTGVLAEFASAGLIGSDAGTSFKTMLLAMANPTGQTKAMMDDLGISFYDAQGKFIGLSGVAQVLHDKLSNLTDAQRQQALGQIFGNDAIRAASVLYSDGAAGVQKWAQAVNDNGYAASTASKLTDNLSGDLERLKGSLETVAIQAGGGATGGLRALTKGVNGAVNAFADLPSGVQSALTVISGVGGGALLAVAGFVKARSTVKDFLDELKEMGPRGTAFAGGISKVAGVAGKLTLAGTAAVGLYEGFKLFGDWIDHFTAPTVRNVDKMTDALKEFASTGQVTGELAKTFGANLAGLQGDFQKIATLQKQIASLSSFPQSVYAGRGGGAAPNSAALAQAQQQLAQLKQNTTALDAALSGLATNGGATQARIAFERLATATGITISELPQYQAAAKSAAVANTGLAKGFGDATANSKSLASSLSEAISAGQTLTDVWNQLHGALLETDKASLAAAQAIDDVKKSFKDNKDAITGNSEAALKNRIAVGEAAKAAAAAAEAKYEETGSVKDANKVYDLYIGQLRKTLTQAGLNKAQVDKLLGAYGKMPPSVATNIKQPGIDHALTQTQALWDKLKGVDGNWVANIKTTGYADTANKLRHLLAAQQAAKNATSVNEANRELGHFFARGGPVVGPGTTTSDSIPARLSTGEHVWTAKEVEAAGGHGAMMAMRAQALAGPVAQFAAGGPVNMPFPYTTSKTQVPNPAYTAPGGIGGNVAQGGGPGYKWMEMAVRAAFPGMPIYSDYRPGAITLTGNRSYHSVGRAVDFAPSKPLAEWINLHFMRQTKELITPWQSLNIRNGARHQYSALVENEHNFAGGNAHDHWAMANGGMITEPIFGIGASGRTYSFGENYQHERVTPMWQTGGHGGGSTINITFSGPVGSQYELKQWLVGTINDLKRKGRV
jgi:TP901 family phage tail tape measure protein